MIRRLTSYLIGFALLSSIGTLVVTSSDLSTAEARRNKKEAKEAELHRQHQEMKRLAGRNAWKGVNASYKAILKLRLKSTPAEVHMLGAQAACELGNIKQGIKRLKAAGNAGSSELSAIYQAYGKVKIKKGKKKVLKPSVNPFAASARAAIEFANQVLKTKSSFKGWLPVGSYQLGAANFTVKATKKTQTFKGK